MDSHQICMLILYGVYYIIILKNLYPEFPKTSVYRKTECISMGFAYLVGLFPLLSIFWKRDFIPDGLLFIGILCLLVIGLAVVYLQYNNKHLQLQINGLMPNIILYFLNLAVSIIIMITHLNNKAAIVIYALLAVFMSINELFSRFVWLNPENGFKIHSPLAYIIATESCFFVYFLLA